MTLDGNVIKYIHQKNTNYNWEEARNACESLGLGLPVPQNESENDFFLSLVFPASDGRLSLGISDAKNEGIWKNIYTGLFKNNLIKTRQNSQI